MRPQAFRTKITDLFGIRHPILCGGLQWLADANYVAAVVNAGAMGFITALSFPGDVDGFRRELAKCRRLTQGKPFGVSLSLSRRPGVNDRLDPYIDALLDARVEFIETSGDRPDNILLRLKAGGCKVIHKVASIRNARSVQSEDVDAITVVSAEEGGHPGNVLIPQIIQAVLASEAVTKPLVIGGGMGTGQHICAGLAMGADAVLMGSRMLAAKEIWAHSDYKRQVVASSEADSVLVMKSTGNPHRVMTNNEAKQVMALEMNGASTFEDFLPHSEGARARNAYLTGKIQTGLMSLGPAAVFARKVEPVEIIIDQMIDEAILATERIQSLMSCAR